MKLIAIGDSVCDCYIEENIFFPGGNCYNVAVHAKRCGAEETSYTGVLGDDYMADYLTECLEKEGVKAENCRRMYAASAQTGVKLVNGDRVFVAIQPYSCQKIAAIKITAKDLELAKTADVCHISCYSNLEYELETLAKAVALSFDFSEIKDDGYFKKVCPHLTYAFLSGSGLSDDECKALAQKLHSLGTKNVCITQGSKGSFFSDGQNFYRHGIVKVEVVDTMGAGDSYIAAFLVHYTENKDVPKAMEAAAAYAAHNCTKRGAIGYAHTLSI
ncbi:MAG: carbohydrate kinase [Ruminococcaceae bacterium]|nr:carbohydrate kinase [Oscillospiraceae bacterium]